MPYIVIHSIIRVFSKNPFRNSEAFKLLQAALPTGQEFFPDRRANFRALILQGIFLSIKPIKEHEKIYIAVVKAMGGSS